jgi:P27 family predicted phage terminase small subunit
MRGRKQTPTKLKLLKNNPGKRELNAEEPKVEVGIPECPKALSKIARQEWNRVVPELARIGVLGKIDSAGIAAYCQAYSRWLQAEKEIDANGITIETKFKDKEGNVITGDLKKNPAVTVANDALRMMRAFASEYGLTPASRTRIHANPDEGEEDPADKYFDQRSGAGVLQ